MAKPRLAAIAIDAAKWDDVQALIDVADVVDVPGVGIIGPTPFFCSGEQNDRGRAALRTPTGVPGHMGLSRPRDLGPTILDLLGRPASPLVTGQSLADRITQPASAADG